jgi:GntR family transcriptional regulator
MLFRLTDSAGQPRYLQLMQQIRHAIESGALSDGDQLPSIRALAEELVVSPGTVTKAYSELEHEGLVAMHPGAGAFVCVGRRARRLGDRVQAARERVDDLIDELRDDGLLDDEIRRLFEAGLLRAGKPGAPVSKR